MVSPQCYVARTILLIILVIVLLGGFSGFGGCAFYRTGHYGGGLDLVLVIVLVLVFARQALNCEGSRRRLKLLPQD